VNEGTDVVQIKLCGICNVDVPENAEKHKRSTKLIKDKLKQKVRSFNIRRLRRNFQNIDFETNDYIVKKVRRSVRGMFLNIRNNTKE
jgi:hypothetical protein